MDLEKKLESFSFEFEALEACPLCRSKVMIPNGKIDWLGFDFWYVMCPNCGLKFMNPRPTMISYRDFYKDFFWQQKIRNLGFKKEGQMWQTKRYKWDGENKWTPEEGRLNRIKKQKEQRIQTIIPIVENNINIDNKSNVLDVGCGFGIVLEEFKNRFGCSVYGIEPSEESADDLRSKEIEVLGRYAEDLSEISDAQIKFDVIMFSHSLENTVDPLSIINSAKQCLRDGGIIYIQTPNLTLFDQMNPYHPFIFSESSLAFLADKAGLKAERASDSLNKMLIMVFKK